jgi:hypothetical protein
MAVCAAWTGLKLVSFNCRPSNSAESSFGEFKISKSDQYQGLYRVSGTVNIPADPKMSCSAIICATDMKSLCVGCNQESKLGVDGFEAKPGDSNVGFNIKSCSGSERWGSKRGEG